MSDSPKKSIRDVKLGENTRIADFVNMYECEVGDNSTTEQNTPVSTGLGGAIDVNATATTPFLIGLEKGVPYTAVAVNSLVHADTLATIEDSTAIAGGDASVIANRDGCSTTLSRN